MTFILAIIIIIVYLVYKDVILPKKEKEINEQWEEEKRRFENGEMSAYEREKYIKSKIRHAEQMYNSGQLSFLELQALKKSLGCSNTIDDLGFQVTATASNKFQAERAVEQQQKKAERDLIFQTTVGGAINGTTGAIIGATASANESAKEAAALEARRASAENKFQEALNNGSKGK
jgi:hypothetical protein